METPANTERLTYGDNVQLNILICGGDGRIDAVSPRRTALSSLETSSQFDTVPPFAASAHLSRRGPDVKSVEEVLQPAISGKYFHQLELSASDITPE